MQPRLISFRFISSYFIRRIKKNFKFKFKYLLFYEKRIDRVIIQSFEKKKITFGMVKINSPLSPTNKIKKRDP